MKFFGRIVKVTMAILLGAFVLVLGSLDAELGHMIATNSHSGFSSDRALGISAGVIFTISGLFVLLGLYGLIIYLSERRYKRKNKVVRLRRVA
ncbi:MAG TPA: hypothetical protein VFK97_02960 [Candidatus Saccharimonadales bacterium]|nr:hypothetical protein [Candidatus Saccharimonadales bacterium]